MTKVRYNIELDEAVDGKVILYGQQNGLLKISGEVNKSAAAIQLISEGLDSGRKIEQLKAQIAENGNSSLQGVPTVYDDARRELDKLKDAAGLAGMDTTSGAAMLKSGMDIYLTKRELDELKGKYLSVEKAFSEAKELLESLKKKNSAKENIKDMLEAAKPLLPHITAIMQGKPLPLALGGADQEMPESHAFGEQVYEAFSEDMEQVVEVLQVFSKNRPLLKTFLEQVRPKKEGHAA